MGEEQSAHETRAAEESIAAGLIAYIGSWIQTAFPSGEDSEPPTSLAEFMAGGRPPVDASSDP